VQPERCRAADRAGPVPAVRYRAHVRASGGEPEAAEILLERPVDVPGLEPLALRLGDVQLGLFRDLSVGSSGFDAFTEAGGGKR